ncbi:MAG: L-fucose:H+ symporter permease [Kiritimatiellaeota bacterium]|nr:L-fucose:H+ symporter permease [Kiritimatiellota bacterium]
MKMFTTENGKNLFVTFALVTTLFLLWGFCNGMIDILNKHFQNTLHINKFQSGFVQFANYLAYFLMAIPAGLLAKKFGYKGGIIIGLVLIAAGAFWFIPATKIGTYWAFLTGLFILATGMTCLETIANPYATVLGPPESGATRINMAQTFNGLGWILGPVVGGYFVFGSGGEGAAAAPASNAGLYIPYMGVGIVVTILIIVFAIAYIPDLHNEEEVKAEAAGQAVKPLWTRHHFTLGVLAQFLYVAAQTGIFSFFINYLVENVSGMTDSRAKNLLGVGGFGLFMFGRFCGSFVVGLMKPQKALAIYASICFVLSLLAMAGLGMVGVVALFGTFFFMSIMFPTIFALSIRGLGEHTKLGSSLLVMSIVGGAIAPPVLGYIADHASMKLGFAIPVVCFIVIAAYGMLWKKLEGKDAGADEPFVLRPGH